MPAGCIVRKPARISEPFVFGDRRFGYVRFRRDNERHLMKADSLPALVQEHLTIARRASSGRSAFTVFGGHDHRLRQTLIVLAAGHELADHESPGEATLHVLAGVVSLTTPPESLQLSAGDLVAIPGERHGLSALEDCAVLLTVAHTL